MKKKIVGTGVFTFFAAAVYMMSCLLCIANSNYVSPEDYARMSQEIVEQSIEMEANR
ncbi:hypothetical protein SPSIL_005730 [Sporomusa silvacetica DSM 10669]|uniref:Uncharacterized protein n=1 Tax=Sporomusa silvacetica DSM 10669 TaxID=1123289 RepID=A0ABZ3IFN0_9FIRM|nr:hypothetical protein [Sporomusa silvacetica]OZC17102.1 hypothetical protein SPSIL_34670 [Sporomusa silvacetica DSM 10669]